jgi:hypothetical protein
MGFSYGKVMAVDGESSIYNTFIRRFDRNAPYRAGNTSGGTGRRQGNSYWDGYYWTYALDSDASRQPARFPNDQFSLDAAFETGSLNMSGTARCTELEIIWDFVQGTYVEHKVSFKCDGALSVGSTSPSDSSIACPMPVKDCLLKIDTGSGDTTVGTVNYMRLLIRSLVCPVCNSSTSGQWQHKEGDTDIIAQWRVDSDSPDDWPTISANAIVKMYVTATKYWELKWMRIRGIDPMFQDKENPERVTQFVVTAEMNASDCTSLGYVNNPATTTKWNS